MFCLTHLNLVTLDTITFEKNLILKILNYLQKVKCLHYKMAYCTLANKWPATCLSNGQHLLNLK